MEKTAVEKLYNDLGLKYEAAYGNDITLHKIVQKWLNPRLRARYGQTSRQNDRRQRPPRPRYRSLARYDLALPPAGSQRIFRGDGYA